MIQEDADAVGLSILSGAHMTLVPRVLELLKEQGADDVIVTVGGTIPADDVAGAQGARRGGGVHAGRVDPAGGRLHPQRGSGVSVRSHAAPWADHFRSSRLTRQSTG